MPLEVPDPAGEALRRLCERRLMGGRSVGPAEADEIDACLRACPTIDFLALDRARLADSVEAWLHVVIRAPGPGLPPGGPDDGLFTGFGPVVGVLTWMNSD